MAFITSTKSPSLIVPDMEYKTVNEDLFRNQLRLYFNQIDGNNNAVKTNTGGYNTLYWIGDN